MRNWLVLLLTIPLMGCPEGGKLIISDACETAYEIFYPDGRFSFTESEIDHMRPVNQTKIANFKAWFQQQCPEQYARTAGGKKRKG